MALLPFDRTCHRLSYHVIAALFFTPYSTFEEILIIFVTAYDFKR